MKVTPELVAKAKQLAEDNYSTWGQWIVECYSNEELAEALADFESLEDWVDIRIRVAEVYEERLSY